MVWKFPFIIPVQNIMVLMFPESFIFGPESFQKVNFSDGPLSKLMHAWDPELFRVYSFLGLKVSKTLFSLFWNSDFLSSVGNFPKSWNFFPGHFSGFGLSGLQVPKPLKELPFL
jgi:hypothetical protein